MHTERTLFLHMRELRLFYLICTCSFLDFSVYMYVYLIYSEGRAFAFCLFALLTLPWHIRTLVRY